MRRKFKKDLRDMLVYTNQEYLLLSNYEIRRRSAAKIIKRNVLHWFRDKQKVILQRRSSLKI